MDEIVNLIRLAQPTGAQEVIEAAQELQDAQSFMLSMLRNDDTFNGYSDEVLWDAIIELSEN